MPIRHCQKCSLKVLIDDAQASVTPFYCQRCTAALQGGAPVPAPAAAPAAARRASSPQLTPVPATAAVAVASEPSSKPGSVKVFCPYCKASFNGRIPSKPARGSCPLCQKDLILLPTGDIRPAADFDLAGWQSEQQGAPSVKSAKESGTVAMVKKFAADPAAQTSSKAEAGKRALERKIEPPAPVPAEETQTSEDGVELPSWLDDESKRVGQKSSPPVVPAAETDVAEAVRLEDLDPAPPPPPPPPPAPKRSPPPRPATALAVPAAEPEERPAVSVRKGTARREKTERRPAELAEVGASQGAGKFILALLLTFLPVGACPVLLSSKDKLEEKLLKPMGERFTRGFRALDAKLFPVEVAAPPPAKPPPAPAPEPEAPAKPTAEDQKLMEEEINKHWIEYKREDRTFKQRSVGATPEEKAEFQKVEADLKDKKTRIDVLRENYRKLFGKDYDPTKQ